MVISDLELFLIELPASGGAVRSLLVRVTTDNGREGWGETRVAWPPAALTVRRRSLLTLLAGSEVFDVESILASDALTDPAVACGIEMALWDLIAQGARQPLCHLLGGGYRRSVPLAVRLPSGAPETVAHWARAFSAQGIQSQVISASGNLEADLKMIGTLRESCGERVQLRLDGRGLYELRDAAQLVARLETGGLQYLVDPLNSRRTEGMSMLRAAGRVPLAVFAGIASTSDVMSVVRSSAATFTVVDPVRVGGLTRARQCAAVAEAGELAASLRIEGTSGLALAATLQLAAATPSFISGHECTYPKLHDDILVEPLKVVDGMLTVPSAAGLGVEVDRDKLDWYQVGG